MEGRASRIGGERRTHENPTQEASEGGDSTGEHMTSVVIDVAIPVGTPTELFTAGNGETVSSRREDDERLVCLRFPNGESLRTTCVNCADHGVRMDVHRIHHERAD